MRDFLLTALGAGLHDGLNPCLFVACALLITLCLGFQRKGFSRIGWVCVGFVLAYLGGSFSFNFSPLQVVVFQKVFIRGAKIIYFILGVGALIGGILLLKDWFLLNRGTGFNGQEQEPGQDQKISYQGLIFIGLSVVFLGFALSALGTLWPMDPYLMMLGSLAMTKGQWQLVMPLLIFYAIASIWPLWLTCLLLGFKINLRSSLFKILCASIFFVASASMILMFR